MSPAVMLVARFDQSDDDLREGWTLFVTTLATDRCSFFGRRRGPRGGSISLTLQGEARATLLLEWLLSRQVFGTVEARVCACDADLLLSSSSADDVPDLHARLEAAWSCAGRAMMPLVEFSHSIFGRVEAERYVALLCALDRLEGRVWTEDGGSPV
jgi:hypothetical protein